MVFLVMFLVVSLGVFAAVVACVTTEDRRGIGRAGGAWLDPREQREERVPRSGVLLVADFISLLLDCACCQAMHNHLLLRNSCLL